MSVPQWQGEFNHRRVQSPKVGCWDTPCCRIVPDAPEYGASAPSVVRRFSAGVSMAAGFRLLLAMNCQVAAVAADGTEVPYSGAPAVREYGAVLPTNFLGLHPSNTRSDIRKPKPSSARKPNIVNSRYSHYQTRAFSIIPILLWGNIAMFVINNLLTEQALMPWLSLNAWDVRHGQLWRLVSYMFLHGGGWRGGCGRWPGRAY